MKIGNDLELLVLRPADKNTGSRSPIYPDTRRGPEGEGERERLVDRVSERMLTRCSTPKRAGLPRRSFLPSSPHPPRFSSSSFPPPPDISSSPPMLFLFLFHGGWPGPCIQRLKS